MASNAASSVLLSRRPVPCLAGSQLEAVQDISRARLRELGVSSALKKSSGLMKKRAGGGGHGHAPNTPSAAMRTPGKVRGAGAALRVFRRPLRDLSMVMVRMDQEEVLVPKILVFLCDWLKKEDRLALEGVFRKSGSSARQRVMRECVEASESWDFALKEASPLDVAGLLKQWVRELPEALLPLHIQKVMIECYQLEEESSRLEALLLSTCLLPANHSATLLYLSRFFKEVSEHRETNKMDLSNLAIVLTPSFFPMEDSVAAGKKGPPAQDLSSKTAIVETILKHAEQICFVSSYVEGTYNDLALPSGSSTFYSEDDEAFSGTGPSARRRKKKKRRSGSLSRVFSATVKGLQKAMSRSATPVAPRMSRAGMYAAEAAAATDDDSIHCTPLPQKSAAFTSPRLPAKRKALLEHDLSPRSKQQRQAASSSSQSAALPAASSLLESAFTPKVRKGSFSVKKLRERKSFSSKNPPVLHNFSPLPSKPNLNIATPVTPAVVDIKGRGEDILSPAEPVKKTRSSGSVEEINSSMASLTTEPKAPPKITRKTSAGDVMPRRKSTSPAERKIGMTRGRSQDITKKEEKMTTTMPAKTDISKKENLTNISDLRTQLRNKTAAAPPATTPLRKKVSPVRATPSKPPPSRKKTNESISNLKQDISSFIEQSFGPGDISRDLDVHGLATGDFVDGADAVFGDEVDRSNNFLLPPSASAASASSSTSAAAVSCSAAMRRQSSAFEFVRRGSISEAKGAENLRRQSSAFEIAARNREQYGSAATTTNLVQESFARVGTRSSLRRKNSSVKDLVQKMEASTMRKPPQLPPRRKKEEESKKNENSNAAEEEWMDAAEFFSNPAAPSLPKHMLQEDVALGCKRSSIIKIRRDNKGKVSQFAETFTRPRPPMPLPPTTTTAAPATSSRRLSARMGVSLTPSSSLMASSSASKRPPAALPSSSSHQRRQTLTGIRTSANHKLASPSLPPRSPRMTTSAALKAKDVCPVSTPKAGGVGKRRTPAAAERKSKRHEGRRHLTIGYVGEVRSPLQERQNIIATVQRSKSAQTPLQNKPARRATAGNNYEDDVLHPMVLRSQSIKSPEPPKTLAF